LTLRITLISLEFLETRTFESLLPVQYESIDWQFVLPVHPPVDMPQRKPGIAKSVWTRRMKRLRRVVMHRRQRRSNHPALLRTVQYGVLIFDMRFASREQTMLSRFELGAGFDPGDGPMARLPRPMG
jgi:hypothetical protein